MTDKTQTDVVMRLLDKIEEQQDKIQELEKHTAKLQAHKNIKQSQQEEENNEDETTDEDVFFKAMKPRQVGYSERKNAISEWFKSQDSKFHTASIPKISEEVFGYRTRDSKNKHYIAIRNAIQKEPRVIPSNSKDGKFKEYKLSPKVKKE